MSEWQDKAKEIGEAVIDKTKDALGDAWDSLTDEDKDVLKRTTAELAELEARALIGQEPDPERLAILKATILNYKAAGAISAYQVQSAFLSALQAAASVAGGFLAGFARSLLTSIVPIFLAGFARSLLTSIVPI